MIGMTLFHAIGFRLDRRDGRLLGRLDVGIA
jgi:hypothetical protein